jgi:hypothetical protein
VVHVAWIAGLRNGYNILVRKSGGKTVWARHIWDDNSKRRRGLDSGSNSSRPL